jgi:hypothetical protein
LAEWLAGGALAVTRADEVKTDALSPRRKGIRRAGKLMFFSVVLLPVFLVLSLIFDEGAPMLFPLLMFFVALAMMLYARLFSDKTVTVNGATLNNQAAAQTSALGSSSARGALPPAANNPLANASRPQVRTNELAQPPSVTENTTKLLDNE